MGKNSSQEKEILTNKIIDIEIEKSRLNREKSIIALNKAVLFYFSFMLVAILGFINEYINRTVFNILIISGLCVLIIGTLPYLSVMAKEDKHLDTMIKNLKKSKGGE